MRIQTKVAILSCVLALPAFCATSYSNTLGTGDRTLLIRTTAASGLIGDNCSCNAQDNSSVNGMTSQTVWFFAGVSLSSTYWLQWDMGSQVTIDEAKYYQQTGAGQGTWKWQGSNDESSWTDIGTSFALGGTTTQTITALNGNVTAYQFYRILGVSGSTSSSPFAYQFEFKVSPMPSLAYSNAQGSGDRSATITVTDDGTFISGTKSHTVNGDVTENNWFFNGITVTGSVFLEFDFGSALTIDEMRLYQQFGAAQGTWQAQGSNNNSTWTSIGSSFTLGTGGGGLLIQRITAMAGNTTAYRYYRLLGVSGTCSSGPWQREFEFRAGTLSPPPAAGASSVNGFSPSGSSVTAN